MAGIMDMIAPIPSDTDVLQNGPEWAVKQMCDNALHKANYALSEPMLNSCTCAAIIKITPLIYNNYIMAPDIASYIKANLARRSDFPTNLTALLYAYAFTFRYHKGMNGTGKAWSEDPKDSKQFDSAGSLLRSMRAYYDPIAQQAPREPKKENVFKRAANSEAAKQIKNVATQTAKAAVATAAEQVLTNGTGGQGVKQFAKETAKQAVQDVKTNVKNEAVYQAQRVAGVNSTETISTEKVESNDNNELFAKLSEEEQNEWINKLYKQEMDRRHVDPYDEDYNFTSGICWRNAKADAPKAYARWVEEAPLREQRAKEWKEVIQPLLFKAVELEEIINKENITYSSLWPQRPGNDGSAKDYQEYIDSLEEAISRHRRRPQAFDNEKAQKRKENNEAVNEVEPQTTEQSSKPRPKALEMLMDPDNNLKNQRDKIIKLISALRCENVPANIAEMSLEEFKKIVPECESHFIHKARTYHSMHFDACKKIGFESGLAQFDPKVEFDWTAPWINQLSYWMWKAATSIGLQVKKPIGNSYKEDMDIFFQNLKEVNRYAEDHREQENPTTAPTQEEATKDQAFELKYSKAKAKDAELREKDPDRYLAIQVPEPPAEKCPDERHREYMIIGMRVRKYKELYLSGNSSKREIKPIPTAEAKLPENVTTTPPAEKQESATSGNEQLEMLRNYPDEQISLKVFQEVMQKYNMPVPVHELCNRATRQWDELDLDKWERPIYFVACNVGSKWMRDTIKEIDDVYNTSQHVKNYIAKYFHDNTSAKTPDEIREEWDATAKALPQTIQAYNACSNFKMCCYITTQLSKQGNENVDISDALFGNDAYAVDYLDKLEELVKNGEPVDIAKSEASDHANAMHKDYVEQEFSKETTKRKSSGVIETATRIAMAPANFKYDMNKRVRDAIVESSPNGAEILQKMDKKREMRAQEKVERRMEARADRAANRANIRNGYDSRRPGRHNSRGTGQPNTMHTIALCAPVLIAFICVLLMIATSFSFKWICYGFSIIACVFAIVQELKKNKMSLVFSVIGLLVLALTILF